MGIDKDQRAKRDAARHKKTKTEAVDSFVSVQKDEVVHSHQDGIKTVTRAGVVIRNDKNVGHEAMQRARELIERVESVTFKDNRATTGTNDDWFEEHQESVEQQIRQNILLQKGRVMDNEELYQRIDLETDMSDSEKREAYFSEADSDFDNYRPVVDDDAEIYVPKSERK